MRSRSVEAVNAYSLIFLNETTGTLEAPDRVRHKYLHGEKAEAAKLDKELGGRFVKTSTKYWDDWDESNKPYLPEFLVGQILVVRARKSRIEAEVLYEPFGKNECFECEMTMTTLKTMLLPLDFRPPQDSFFAETDDEESLVDLQSPNFAMKAENSKKSDEDEEKTQEKTPDRRNGSNNNGPTPPLRKKEEVAARKRRR